MIENNFKKLLDFQSKVESIKKDSTNPFFKSSYFDINSLLKEIMPVLNELKIVLTQPLKIDNGKNILETNLIDSENGCYLVSSSIILPEITDPQKMGSVITYYRRYSLQTLLALQAEDTDGEIGQHNTAQNKEPNKQPINF